VTVRRYAGILRSAFNSAMLDGLIATNPVQPASRLSLPKVDQPPMVPLSVAQVQAWAEHADTRIKAMIIAQAGLGLRIGELNALRLADVDFLGRRPQVRISEQIDTFTGRRAPLKTANSRRVVPLPAFVAEALAEHIRTYPPGDGGLIFTQTQVSFGRDGRRYTNHSERTTLAPQVWNKRRLNELYNEAAEAAALPAGTTSHDLRHHYASVLLDSGHSVHAVADAIGDRPEMVLRIYGHVLPDREESTRRALDAAWEAPASEPGAEGRRRKE
jgi:integrase